MKNLSISDDERIADLHRWERRRAIVNEIARITLWMMDAVEKGFPPTVDDTIVERAPVAIPRLELGVYLVPDAVAYTRVNGRMKKVPGLADRRGLIADDDLSEI